LCGVFFLKVICSITGWIILNILKNFGEAEEFPDSAIASSLSKKGYHGVTIGLRRYY
jgi:hypothetical protein